MKSSFVTTAIDYTNAAPHIGHVYEKILADVIARYRRLKGEPTFFLTGVDQHGQKVQQAAQREGVPEEKFVRETTEKFVALWKEARCELRCLGRDNGSASHEVRAEIFKPSTTKGRFTKRPIAGFTVCGRSSFSRTRSAVPTGIRSEWGEGSNLRRRTVLPSCETSRMAAQFPRPAWRLRFPGFPLQ